MFTGIIEETGKVISVQKSRDSYKLSIQGDVIFGDLKLGDSVAVNGVCLTVSAFSGKVFTADVMSETLNRSSLGQLKAESPVNLERAMAANGRFGGHIVSGHIDGTGAISNIRRDGNALWLSIRTTDKVLRYIVEKGSIAIDGVSLTVARVWADGFEVSLIPHTADHTVLVKKGMGAKVNLENDIIGKYVEKLMTPGQGRKMPQGGITSDFLAGAGF